MADNVEHNRGIALCAVAVDFSILQVRYHFRYFPIEQLDAFCNAQRTLDTVRKFIDGEALQCIFFRDVKGSIEVRASVSDIHQARLRRKPLDAKLSLRALVVPDRCRIDQFLERELPCIILQS